MAAGGTVGHAKSLNSLVRSCEALCKILEVKVLTGKLLSRKGLAAGAEAGKNGP